MPDKQKPKPKQLISSDNCMSSLCAINWLFYLYAPFEDCRGSKGMSCRDYLDSQIPHQFLSTSDKSRVIHSVRANAEGKCVFWMGLLGLILHLWNCSFHYLQKLINTRGSKHVESGSCLFVRWYSASVHYRQWTLLPRHLRKQEEKWRHVPSVEK